MSHEVERDPLHNQKLEAIGLLAGGVAHDFNNILTAILGALDLLRTNPSLDQKANKHLGYINDAALRGAALVKQILNFSSRSPSELAGHDLNDLVAGVSLLLERLLGEGVSLRYELAHEVLPIMADPGRFQQLLVNLAINARDAMQKGGELVIHTKQLASASQATGNILLSVRDTGVGISDESIPKVFDPFFTTKDQGRGAGLGLSICKQIVGEMLGEIAISSSLGVGTEFRMTFPRAELMSPTVVVDQIREPRAQGEGTILFVEDEGALRDLTYEVLTSVGWVVKAAGNGREALELSEQCKNKIDLLITDVVMPQMGGLDLAKELSAKCERLRVLYISGYSADLRLRTEIDSGKARFLAKPFRPTELLKVVSETVALHG